MITYLAYWIVGFFIVFYGLLTLGVFANALLEWRRKRRERK